MTLTSRMRRKSSSGITSNGENAVTAAQLAHTSTRPNRSKAALASASTAAGSLTSVGTASAEAPSASHSALAASRATGPRAARTTAAPRLANAKAVARPMPLDAPVTTITESLTRMDRRARSHEPQTRAGEAFVALGTSVTGQETARMWYPRPHPALASVRWLRYPRDGGDPVRGRPVHRRRPRLLWQG